MTLGILKDDFSADRRRVIKYAGSRNRIAIVEDEDRCAFVAIEDPDGSFIAGVSIEGEDALLALANALRSIAGLVP